MPTTKPTKRPRPAYGWDAAKVKALRDHLGLTQTEFSHELGVRQQTVSEWECGQYKPRGASSTLLTVIAERAQFDYATPPSPRTPKGKSKTAD